MEIKPRTMIAPFSKSVILTLAIVAVFSISGAVEAQSPDPSKSECDKQYQACINKKKAAWDAQNKKDNITPTKAQIDANAKANQAACREEVNWDQCIRNECVATVSSIQGICPTGTNRECVAHCTATAYTTTGIKSCCSTITDIGAENKCQTKVYFAGMDCMCFAENGQRSTCSGGTITSPGTAPQYVLTPTGYQLVMMPPVTMTLYQPGTIQFGDDFGSTFKLQPQTPLETENQSILDRFIQRNGGEYNFNSGDPTWPEQSSFSYFFSGDQDYLDANRTVAGIDVANPDTQHYIFTSTFGEPEMPSTEEGQQKDWWGTTKTLAYSACNFVTFGIGCSEVQAEPARPPEEGTPAFKILTPSGMEFAAGEQGIDSSEKKFTGWFASDDKPYTPGEPLEVEIRGKSYVSPQEPLSLNEVGEKFKENPNLWIDAREGKTIYFTAEDGTVVAFVPPTGSSEGTVVDPKVTSIASGPVTNPPGDLSTGPVGDGPPLVAGASPAPVQYPGLGTAPTGPASEAPGAGYSPKGAPAEEPPKSWPQRLAESLPKSNGYTPPVPGIIPQIVAQVLPLFFQPPRTNTPTSQPSSLPPAKPQGGAKVNGECEQSDVDALQRRFSATKSDPVAIQAKIDAECAKKTPSNFDEQAPVSPIRQLLAGLIPGLAAHPGHEAPKAPPKEAPLDCSKRPLTGADLAKCAVREPAKETSLDCAKRPLSVTDAAKCAALAKEAAPPNLDAKGNLDCTKPQNAENTKKCEQRAKETADTKAKSDAAEAELDKKLPPVKDDAKKLRSANGLPAGTAPLNKEELEKIRTKDAKGAEAYEKTSKEYEDAKRKFEETYAQHQRKLNEPLPPGVKPAVGGKPGSEGDNLAAEAGKGTPGARPGGAPVAVNPDEKAWDNQKKKNPLFQFEFGTPDGKRLSLKGAAEERKAGRGVRVYDRTKKADPNAKPLGDGEGNEYKDASGRGGFTEAGSVDEHAKKMEQAVNEDLKNKWRDEKQLNPDEKLKDRRGDGKLRTEGDGPIRPVYRDGADGKEGPQVGRVITEDANKLKKAAGRVGATVKECGKDLCDEKGRRLGLRDDGTRRVERPPREERPSGYTSPSGVRGRVAKNPNVPHQPVSDDELMERARASGVTVEDRRRATNRGGRTAMRRWMWHGDVAKGDNLVAYEIKERVMEQFCHQK